MRYYASGLPMHSSEGESAQNRKYNGKEFIEAYGLNTCDYGFRGYYPAIGRFTSIDPMAELTPWQSTYSYANNNYIGEKDILGLYSHNIIDDLQLNFIVINKDGDIEYAIDDDDNHIYLDERGDWKPEDGKGNLVDVGTTYEKIPYDILIKLFRSKKVVGNYYGSKDFSLKITFGAQFGPIAFNNKKRHHRLGLNLSSMMLFEYSTDGEDNTINYIGKDNTVEISQSLGLYIFDISHSQLFKSKYHGNELVPIYNTDDFHIDSMIFNIGLNNLGQIQIGFDLSFLFGISVYFSKSFLYRSENE